MNYNPLVEAKFGAAVYLNMELSLQQFKEMDLSQEDLRCYCKLRTHAQTTPPPTNYHIDQWININKMSTEELFQTAHRLQTRDVQTCTDALRTYWEKLCNTSTTATCSQPTVVTVNSMSTSYSGSITFKTIMCPALKRDSRVHSAQKRSGDAACAMTDI